MITANTVFVLGAGASVPYNYPCGRKLCQNICHELRSEYMPAFKQLLKCEFSKDNITDFRNALSRNIGTSIDIFLQNNHRKFLEIGKFAIAQELIQYENENTLFEYNDKNWYRELSNYLIRDCRNHNDFLSNNIAFITFNYDRSLEHYLYRGLKDQYGDATLEDIANIVNRIPIIHIYGILDRLPWQRGAKDGGRDYNSIIDEKILRKSTQELNIVCEGVKKELSRDAISEMFEEADFIHFIGFGYDRDNLHRLGIPSAQKRGLRPISGSAYDIRIPEQERIKKYFLDKLTNSIELGRTSEDAVEFIKSYVLR